MGDGRNTGEWLEPPPKYLLMKMLNFTMLRASWLLSRAGETCWTGGVFCSQTWRALPELWNSQSAWVQSSSDLQAEVSWTVAGDWEGLGLQRMHWVPGSLWSQKRIRLLSFAILKWSFSDQMQDGQGPMEEATWSRVLRDSRTIFWLSVPLYYTSEIYDAVP